MSSGNNPSGRSRTSQARFAGLRAAAGGTQQSTTRARTSSRAAATSSAPGASTTNSEVSSVQADDKSSKGKSSNDKPSKDESSEGKSSKDESSDNTPPEKPKVFGLPPAFNKGPKDFKFDNLQPQLARGPGLLVLPTQDDRQFKALLGADNCEEPSEDEEEADNEDDNGDEKSDNVPKERNSNKEPYTIKNNKYSAQFLRGAVSTILKPKYDPAHRLSVHMKSGNSEIHETGPKNPPAKNTRSQDNKPGKTFHRHLDYASKPISNIYEIGDEMTRKLIKDGKLGNAFLSSLKAFEQYGLRVFTMCSGTEAPILAMDLIREGLERHGHTFNYQHIASAEIEPFKQGYIELNFHPPHLFRDVTEFAKTKATTAYGSVVEVPGDCHIVIAGSACVDYSLLNKHPKKFGKKGESWSTMRGIIKYCTEHEPSMVLLENIKGAPWGNICSHWHNYIGYDVKAVIVDSKDFYIPQTRQRGYMLGINRKRAQEAGFDTTVALEAWAEYFRSFQHRASVPYTDIILDSDSIENERNREKICNLSQPPDRSQPWTACAHRYKDLRSRTQVGDHRPYTLWNENGSSTPKDYTWTGWVKNQRDRVLDTLDIAFLRYILRRDYDMAYKSRSIDLSQNIDRDLDSKHYGILGCLTSAALLYDTHRGGPLSGLEALKMQGIPVDDLILDKLNIRQMYDLAGNAMTTTVVGSAVMAAIAAGTQNGQSVFFKPSPENRKSPKNIKGTAVKSPEECEKEWSAAGLEKRQISLSVAAEKYIDKRYLDELCQTAEQTRQLCTCEGVTRLHDVKFLICGECGHKVCKTCSGNPEHKYRDLAIQKGERIKPDLFMSYVKSTLPRSLRFLFTEDSLRLVLAEVRLAPTKVFGEKTTRVSGRMTTIDHGNGTWAQHIKLNSERDEYNKPDEYLDDPFVDKLTKTFRDCISKAFAYAFHYREIKRGAHWKVEFSSETARLELWFHQVDDELTPHGQEFFADRGSFRCYWLLYAVCNKEVPLGDMLREQLRSPIARMHPNKGLFDGQWQLIQPQNNSLVATIRGTGPTAALQARIGLQADGYADIKVYKHMHVSFQARDNDVEAPKEIDFEYLGDCGTASSLLYRSTGSAASGMQSYLFLDPWHLQDQKFDCMVIANDHSRLDRNQDRPVLVKFASGWRPVVIEGHNSYEWQVVCESTDRCLALEGATLEPNISELGLPMWSPTGALDFPSLLHCNDAAVHAVAIAVPQYPEFINAFGDHDGILPDQRIKLDLRDPRGHLKQLAWLLHALPIPIELQAGATVPMHLVRDICDRCSPPLSKPVWQWSRRRQGKILALIPRETDEKAAEREIALKGRPEIAFAWLNFSANLVLMSIHLNIKSMVHRTAAPLLRLTQNFNDLDVSWKIIAYDINELPTPYKVPHLLDNSDDPPRTKPRSFKRDLWDSQARTFHWMKNVENGIEWEEKHIKDYAIKPLSWKIIASATRKTKVRGGIIADDVGTGKTTVAYALIGDDMDNNIQPPVEKTKIAVRATVVLVPTNLVEQWCQQAKKCFGEDRDAINVLPVKDIKQLKGLTIRDIKEADAIIFSSGIFDNRIYWDDLRKLCCLPNVPSSSGRALMQWLEDATENLDELCEASLLFTKTAELKKKRDDLWKRQKGIKERPFRPFQTHDTKDELKAPKLEFSINAVQSAYPEAYQQSAPDPKTEISTPDLPISTHSQDVLAFLQLFSFRRLIVDEYQYLTPRMAAAAIHMSAGARWLLSGTPPIDSLDNVDQMARLIGTRVTPRPNELVIRGFAAAKGKVQVREKTWVEEFEEYNDVVSVESENLQIGLAQDFLEKFVRMNAVATSHLKTRSQLIAVTPSPVELSVFYQFYNVLSNQAIKYANKPMPEESLTEAYLNISTKASKSRTAKATQPNRTKAIIRLLGNSTCAEETLICCYRLAIQSFAALQPLGITIESIFNELHKEVISEGKYLKTRAEQAVHYWLKTTPAERALEKGDFKNWCSEVLRDQCLADLDVTLMCDDILGAAYERRAQIPVGHSEMLFNAKKDSNTATIEHTDDRRDTRNKENTAKTADLREASERLLVSVRASRFMHSINSISNIALIECMKCGKNSSGDQTAFQVVLTCGHIACAECLQQAKKAEDPCPAEGCGVALHVHNMLDTKPFVPGVAGSAATSGTRPKEITNLLNSITAAGATDCVVVFLQYYPQVVELRAALNAAGLKYTDACVPPKGGSTKQAAESIEMFKNLNMFANKSSGEPRAFSADLSLTFRAGVNDVEQRSRILLLMIDSEDAAGWNLQVCSHVVFAAPYVARSEFRYKAVIKQATGRALRAGQQKPVTVYQFAMCYTNEINMLEERGGGRAVKKVDGRVRWVDRGAEGESVAGPALVHDLEGEDEGEAEAEGV